MRNRFYTIILALGWWLLGRHNDNGCGTDMCQKALEDVSWVLDQMLASDVDSLEKRDDEEESSAAPKKRYVFYCCSFLESLS